MTVAELIAVLQKHPQELQVAYRLYSDYCLLDASDLRVMDLCEPRNDGWLESERPDKAARKYLVFPGN